MMRELRQLAVGDTKDVFYMILTLYRLQWRIATLSFRFFSFFTSDCVRARGCFGQRGDSLSTLPVPARGGQIPASTVYRKPPSAGASEEKAWGRRNGHALADGHLTDVTKS